MSRRKSQNRSVSTKFTRQTPKKTNLWPWIGFGIAVLALIIITIILWPKNSQVREISVAEAYQKVQQGVFVLDVRTPEEWDQMHIANTTLVPLEELSNNFDQLPKNQEILVVCRSGRRSKDAVAILKQAGFTNLSSMSGGLSQWQAAGYPLEGATP